MCGRSGDTERLGVGAAAVSMCAELFLRAWCGNEARFVCWPCAGRVRGLGCDATDTAVVVGVRVGRRSTSSSRSLRPTVAGAQGV